MICLTVCLSPSVDACSKFLLRHMLKLTHDSLDEFAKNNGTKRVSTQLPHKQNWGYLHSI